MLLKCPTVLALAIKVQLEVADVFRLYGDAYRQGHSLPLEERRVMRQIEICRTSFLGGHIDKCEGCGFEKNSYNSCRNRHCPKCRILAKERWLNDRRAELLPTGYFHLVFTLPHLLNPLILCNKKVALDILFCAVNETLQGFAKNPNWRLNGRLGFIAVLHTWTQTLRDHFHLHCLVPAGALSFDNKRWTHSRKKFLFRVESLAKEFRKLYLLKLERSYKKRELIFPGNTANTGTPKGFQKLIKEVENKEWIAFAKRPFKRPERVLDYLGRYTHRVAISNERIKSIEDGKVTFTYKNRNKKNKKNKIDTISLDADEFIRRFLLHVLPDNFMKIRYFGFLAHTKKKKLIPIIRKLLETEGRIKEKEPEKKKETVEEIMLRLTGKDIRRCPHCKKGKLIRVAEIPKPVYRQKKNRVEIWDSS